MGVNPDLLIVRKPGDLDVAGAFDPGSLLFAGADNILKRIDAEKFYQLIGNVAKPLSPTDAAPSAIGWYKPQVYSDSPGTNYPNAGNLKAINGYDTLFHFDGTAWKKTESKIPGNSPKNNFDPANNIDPSTMNALERYLSYGDGTGEARDEATTRQQGYYTDALVFTSNTQYTTTPVINTAGYTHIEIQNFTPTTGDYGIKTYSSNTGGTPVQNVRQTGTFTFALLPSSLFLTVACLNYASQAYKVFLIKVVNGSKIINEVNLHSDKILALNKTPSIFKSKIQGEQINIDNMTGATDSEKIDNAIKLIENFGGGQIYFPSRQININKAILVPSNTKIVLDNCQIQMANNIHDNIFRSKGLVPNPAQYGGLCLSATWTENFEIEGIGAPTIRQSVTPLHVGDGYGWRGCSMLFVKCRNYKISNVKIVESHMWSISNEYSEDGEFYNIEFSNTLHANADGLNFRNGCRRMVARKLRGRTNDNAIATTCIDYTVPVQPQPGYSGQALGFTYGDFFGAEDILVEDVQVAAKYGPALILATSPKIKRVTYKDIVSMVSNTPDWVNVMVCGNRFRTFIYGTSYVDGNISGVNIINCSTSIHEYSLGIYGGRIDNILANRIVNTNPSQLGLVENATTTVITTI